MSVIPRIVLEMFVHFSQAFARVCSQSHRLDIFDFVFEEGGLERRGEVVVQTDFDLRDLSFL